MSINSAVVALRLPANPTATQKINVVAAIRRIVRRSPWCHEPPYFNIGHSYRIPGRAASTNWVHTHH